MQSIKLNNQAGTQMLKILGEVFSPQDQYYGFVALENFWYFEPRKRNKLLSSMAI